MRSLVRVSCCCGCCCHPLTWHVRPRAAYQYQTGFLGLPENTTVAEIAAGTAAYCALSWQDAQARYTDPAVAPFLSTYCFNGAYIAALLARGYGFAPGARALRFTQAVNGVETGWALGAMTYEAGLLPWVTPAADPAVAVLLLRTPAGAAVEAAGGALLLAALALCVWTRRTAADGERTPLV
jgi:hypothetical protein